MIKAPKKRSTRIKYDRIRAAVLDVAKRLQKQSIYPYMPIAYEEVARQEELAPSTVKDIYYRRYK